MHHSTPTLVKYIFCLTTEKGFQNSWLHDDKFLEHSQESDTFFCSSWTLHRCWWRMLETRFLVTIVSCLCHLKRPILVTNIHYLLTTAYQHSKDVTKIEIQLPTVATAVGNQHPQMATKSKAPASWCHQHHCHVISKTLLSRHDGIEYVS